MSEVNRALEHVPMFKHLTADECRRVEALASQKVVEAGTPVGGSIGTPSTVMPS